MFRPKILTISVAIFTKFWLPWRVGKLHLVAVDDITEKLGVDARHAALDVELAHEPVEKILKIILAECF